MVEKLINLLKQQDLNKRQLVVAGADDKTVLSAVYQSSKLGFGKPFLVGNKDKISILLKEYSFSANIVDCPQEMIGTEAVRLIKTGAGDVLMKGMIDTSTLLRAVVNREFGIRKGKLLSHATLLMLPEWDRFLIAADCAMIISPSFEEKINIIENTVLVAKALKITKPRVGIVSVSEKVNEKVSSSVDGAKLKDYFLNRDDVLVDGPFGLDNLLSIEAAKHKGIISSVAGVADVLIFPDLDAGNVFYKSAVYLSGAIPSGLIIGASCPIILTSRADSDQAKLNSIILAMVVHDATNNTSN